MSAGVDERVDACTRALADLAAGFSGTLGVSATNLRTGARVALNADGLFPTASTIKLPILLEVAAQVHSGRYAWGQRLTVDPRNRVPGSGVLKDLDDGLSLTLRDLATLMVVVSDNTAANQCIDLLGVERVNESLRRWQCTATTLHRKVTFSPEPLTPYVGTGTPADFARLLERLARGDLLPPGATHAALDILRRQSLTDFVTRYLPYDGLRAREAPDAALTLYSKSGWIEGVRNDVALVRGEGVAYVVALFSMGSPDKRSGPEHEGTLAVARASRIVWDAFGADYRG